MLLLLQASHQQATGDQPVAAAAANIGLHNACIWIGEVLQRCSKMGLPACNTGPAGPPRQVLCSAQGSTARRWVARHCWPLRVHRRRSHAACVHWHCWRRGWGW
jgi:hypothetical protein